MPRGPLFVKVASLPGDETAQGSTKEQRQELRQAHGEEVRLRDPDAQRDYILVPAELYDGLKSLLYDNGDWTAEEQSRLLADSGRRAGWDDPDMDVYDNYDENQKKLCQ